MTHAQRKQAQMGLLHTLIRVSLKPPRLGTGAAPGALFNVIWPSKMDQTHCNPNGHEVPTQCFYIKPIRVYLCSALYGP